MKLTALIKLLPTTEQAEVLLAKGRQRRELYALPCDGPMTRPLTGGLPTQRQKCTLFKHSRIPPALSRGSVKLIHFHDAVNAVAQEV